MVRFALHYFIPFCISLLTGRSREHSSDWNLCETFRLQSLGNSLAISNMVLDAGVTVLACFISICGKESLYVVHVLKDLFTGVCIS